MSDKIQRTWRLSPQVMAIIDSWAKDHSCSSTEALERIVLEYDKRGSDEALAKLLVKEMDDHYKNFFTRIRLGIRSSDINSQVILEILNTLLYSRSIPVAVFTDEKPTPVFLESQKHIQAKIKAYTNVKQGKKKKGGN